MIRKAKPLATRIIEVDELEYVALRRFWLLDKAIENQASPLQPKKRDKLVDRRNQVRGALDLLDLRPLPRIQDRGMMCGIRLRF